MVIIKPLNVCVIPLFTDPGMVNWILHMVIIALKKMWSEDETCQMTFISNW